MSLTKSAEHAKGNLSGLGAIVLWSALPPLIRLVSENIGQLIGAALMFSVASVLLILINGWTPVRKFSIRYLVVGCALFVSYEVGLAVALGLAQDRRQAIEVGLVNYLWPCFTLLLAVLSGQRQASFLLLIPGVLISLFGVGWILSEGGGFSFQLIVANASANPMSYGLALIGAFVWAVYCCVVKPLSQGKDATVLFFVATSIALWVKYLLSDYKLADVQPMAFLELVVAATIMALGYVGWSKGLLTGNLLFLAAVSYAAPVLSSLMGSIILNTTLQRYFWEGALLVTSGSLCCWWATRR